MHAELKLFRTSTFRLATLYLIFFIISIAAVLAYIYYNTVVLLERQNEVTITTDIRNLSDIYHTEKLNGVVGSITRRSTQSNDMLYMLAAPDGSQLAGNLHSLPINQLADNSWVEFTIKADDGNATVGHNARGYNIQLPDNFQLVVARDIEDLRQFRELISRALYWGLGLSAVLGIGSGLVMSRNFLRRVNAITQTSEMIMKGNLTGRMPITGSGDELDRLSLSLNQMLAQIEKLMRGMTEVSSNVAHDLKTPLTRMRARIEDALRNDTKKAQTEALKQTIADCDGLLSTFNALLSITKLETGQQSANLKLLDANAILEDVVDLYGPLVEENNGTLTLNSMPGLHVKARRELLAQALNNLIDNALKYGEENSGAARIVVSGQRIDKYVVLTVADCGTGIPEPDRQRVIERFVRLDESRSKPGNGLGLSLVASVAHVLGGRLILKDNNPGLRAELHLPAVGV